MTNPLKGKKQQLNAVVLLAGLVLGGIWFGLTQPQRAAQQTKTALMSQAKQTLLTTQRTIAQVEKVKTDLASTQQRLQKMEANQPEGDVYRWIIRTFGNLETNN